MTIALKELNFVPFLMCSFSVVNATVSFSVYGFLQPLSYMALGGCILSFLVLLLFFLRKPTNSLFGLATILFFFLLISFTAINGTDLKNAIYTAINIWLFLLLLRYYKEKLPLIVQSFAAAYSICIIANGLQLFLFPELFFSAENTFDSFLLGGNYNQMGSRFLTGIVTSMICTRYSMWWKFNTALLVIISVLTLLFVGSMTSLSLILLFAVFLLTPSTKLLKLVFIGFFTFSLLFQIFVVFSGNGLHNNELAVYIIVDLLGKDITFTNRTEMWDSALRVIGDSPIIGYGYVDADWYLTNMSTAALGPHNFILSIMIFGGVVLLTIYIGIVFMAFRKMVSHTDSIGIKLLLGITTLMFMMCFEVYPLYFIFMLLSFAYYYPQLQEPDKQHINHEDSNNSSNI